jgi:hypothetical protein
MAFVIKQNDTSPAVQASLKVANGNAVNLSGATVKFLMKSLDGVLKVNTNMTVSNAGAGTVNYNWQTGDTDTAGSYFVEFQVTFADGTIETFPNSKNLNISITPDLG